MRSPVPLLAALGVAACSSTSTPDAPGATPPSRPAATIGFAAPRAHPVVEEAAAAMGDFDGDGRADVALVDGDGLHLLRGAADASLAPWTVDPTVTASRLLAEDLDGDGRDDLLLVDDTRVRVLLGDGNGHFAPAATVDVASFVALAGDFDCDGTRDVLAIGATTMTLLHGRGDGTFLMEGGPALSTWWQNGASGDLDGDGCDDVVVRDSVPWLHAWRGTPDGLVDLATVLLPGTLETVADLDGDGRAEVVAAAGGQVGVAGLADDGKFATRAPLPLAGSRALVGDVDGDGRADVVTEAGVALRRADGSYDVVDWHEPQALWGLWLGDVNDDGRADVITAEAGWLTSWRSTGDGTFGGVPTCPNDGDANLTVGDFDGDGRADVIVDDPWAYRVCLGMPGGVRPLPDVAAPGKVTGFAGTGDLDGDGHTDVVAAIGGAWTVLYGRGDGAFDARPLDTSPDAPTAARQGFVADLDGDGHLDVLAATGYPDFLFDVWLGDGHGHFARTATQIAAVFSLGDVDGDGHLDALGVIGSDPHLFLDVARGGDASGGSFVGARGDIADVDGDGIADVVITDDAHGVTVFRGDGALSWTPIATTLHHDPALPLLVTDLDGDGVADLVVHDGPLGVARGLGGGVFAPVAWYASAAAAIRAADVDGDGTLDLVTLGGAVLLQRRPAP